MQGLKQKGKTTNHPLYTTWKNMKQRCYNPKNQDYPRYGARGITVSKRWLASFSNFVDDMGGKPSKRHSLDRINNNRGYSKSNCRWADEFAQANNRSNTNLITYEGKTKNLVNWAEEKDIPFGTLFDRIRRGWSFEKAISRKPQGTELYSFKGKSLRLSAWSKELGIGYSTLIFRLKAGWPIEDMLGIPPILGRNQSRKRCL